MLCVYSWSPNCVQFFCNRRINIFSPKCDCNLDCTVELNQSLDQNRSLPNYMWPITPRVVPTREVASSGETRAAPALGNNGGEMGGVTRNVCSVR